MTISVCVASHGKEEWRELACNRAVPSIKAEFPHEVVAEHDKEATLASVRNACARKATGDWLVFLDADDEFGPSYLDAMSRACERHSNVLLAPAVSFVIRGRRRRPHFSPPLSFREGNPLIIGNAIPRSRFLAVGGFREWPLFEDWDLWARCDLPVVHVPDAVYLAHVRVASRNRSHGVETRNYWHQRIGHDLWPDYYDATTEAEDAVCKVAGVRKQQIV